MRRHDRAVREVLRRMARRFDVRIYDFANVGSHLHLVLRARRREGISRLPSIILGRRGPADLGRGKGPPPRSLF
jgi:hypothetical protein